VATVEGVQVKLLLLGVATASLGLLLRPSLSLGIVVGAGFVSMSVWLYARLFDAAIRTGRRRLALGLTFVKLAAFLALGWVAMSWGAGSVHPLGFAIGVTCLPLAALWEAWRAKGAG
jgi:hypothetical protein